MKHDTPCMTPCVKRRIAMPSRVSQRVWSDCVRETSCTRPPHGNGLGWARTSEDRQIFEICADESGVTACARRAARGRLTGTGWVSRERARTARSSRCARMRGGAATVLRPGVQVDLPWFCQGACAVRGRSLGKMAEQDRAVCVRAIYADRCRYARAPDSETACAPERAARGTPSPVPA